MAGIDPWAKYPEVEPTNPAQNQSVQGADPWANYPEDQGGVQTTPPISPEDQGNPSWLNTAVHSMAGTINPMGKVLEAANQIPYVQSAIPDFLVDSTNANSEGAAGGLYNAAQHGVQLLADIEDYVLPGDSTPASDALNSVFPEYKYSGQQASIGGNITEVGLGFALGNKAVALSKAAGLVPEASTVIGKFVPQVAQKLTQYLWNTASGAASGIGGMTVTTAPDQGGLFTGDNAFFGKWIEGLPTDSPDAAQNALAARVNLAIDGFITGVGIQKGAEGLRAIWNQFLNPVVGSKIAPVFSSNARLKALFDSYGEELSKITGGETPEGLKAIWNRLYAMAADAKAHIYENNLGVAGVNPIKTNLDLATSAARQAKPGDAVDAGIVNVLQGRVKKLTNKGYEDLALQREAPGRELGNALEQTQKVMGGPEAAKTGASDIQRLGKEVVQQGKTEKQMAEIEANKALGTAGQKEGNIIDSTNRADDIREQAKNDLYEAIPADAKYEGASLHKIIEEADGAVPKEITGLLSAKESDGSFKYLYNKVRPRITSLMEKFKNADSTAGQDAYIALKKLRENIDGVQIDELKKSGRTDVVDAVDKAKTFYEKEIAPNRQGVAGDLKRIREKNQLNVEDTFSESRQKLRKTLDNLVTEPEDNKRLYDILASDEGGHNEKYIQQYREATDKAKALENIEYDVYGNRLREFYRNGTSTPMPEGVESFKQLLDDPQSTDRIKYMLDLADKEGSGNVKKALKYAYARSLHEKLNTGFLTELGSEQVSASGVRKALSNDSFINVGKEIYKDTPEFMEGAIDALSLANDIQRSSYLKASPAGWTDRMSETAKKALAKVLNPIYGPLSHRSLQIRTFWGALLEVLGPQEAIDRMEAAMLSKGELFANGYKELLAQKGGRQLIEKSTKVLVNSIMRSDADRKKFDEAAKRIRTEQQTEEAIPQK